MSWPPAGETRLGALLGRNQSFDIAAIAPASFLWTLGAAATSYYTAAGVHSSAYGLRTELYSLAAGSQFLRHFYWNDAAPLLRPDAVVFPGVDTHRARLTLWGHLPTGATSREVRARLEVNATSWANTDPFSGTAAVAALHAAAWYAGESGYPRTLVYPAALTVGSTSHRIDDVLLRLDEVTFRPVRGAEAERFPTYLGEHATMAGGVRRAAGPLAEEWRLPYTHLPTSHQETLTWWWERGLTLLLTLDTSDDTSHRIARLAAPPAGARRAPHGGLWAGDLRLTGAGAGYSLAFDW